MASLQENIDKLKSHCAELERRRYSDPLVNDIYEEADDLLGFAEIILSGDTRVGYPARARQERERIRRLEEFWSKKAPQELRRYDPVFEVAEEILNVAEAIPLPKDGHLGVLKVIRQSFRFLETDYGFTVTAEEPTGMRLSSGAVYLELEYATAPSLSCSFGQESQPQKHFWVEDLLYMYGDQMYKALPQRLKLESEQDVREWFEFLAGIWKQHGPDVLANRPGIFDRLSQAQAQRGEEYGREMDRLYGAAGSDGTGRPK
jgi:hypothetical protein